MDDIAQTGDPLVDVEIAVYGAEPETLATPAEEEAEAPKVRNVKGDRHPIPEKGCLGVGGQSDEYLWVWEEGAERGYSVPRGL